MKKFITLLMIIVVAAFTVTFGINAATQADPEVSMIEGASIRTIGNQGIKFSATVDTAFPAESKHGFYLAVGEHSKEEFVEAIRTGKTTVGRESAKIIKKEVSGKSNTFHAVIYGIPEASYTQDITAIAYIEHDGIIDFAEATITRNISEVAVAQYEYEYTVDQNANTADIVKDIYEAANTTFNLNGGTAVTDSYVSYDSNYTLEVPRYNGYDVAAYYGTEYLMLDNCDTYDNTVVNKGWTRIFIKNVEGDVYKSVAASYVDDTTGDASVTIPDGVDYDYIIGVYLKTDINVMADSTVEYANRLAELTKKITGNLTGNVVDENATLYFRFTLPCEYTEKIASGADITIEVGEMVVSSGAIVDKQYDQLATLPDNVVKEGYTFVGWEDKALASTTSTQQVGKQLTAVWQADNYTISYDLNDGETTSEDMPTTYTIETDTIVLPTASEMTKTDNLFTGWYDNEACTGEPITEISKGSIGNVTLYAGWGTPSTTVTYDANTGYMDELQDVAYTTIANELYSDYKTYSGTTKTITELYQLGIWNVPATSLTQFLYDDVYGTKWKWLSATIISLNPTSNNKTSFTRLENYNSFDEYESSNANYKWGIGYEMVGLMAGKQYSKNSDWITLDYSSETIQDTFIKDYKVQHQVSKTINKYSSDTNVLPVPTKDDCTFLGWYDNPNFEGNEVTSITVNEVGKEITLYAKWQSGILEVGEGKTYTTISDAITAASAGDTIKVYAGTYDETLTIDKSLTIEGPYAGVPGTSESRLDTSDGAIVTGLITITADDVVIDGIKCDASAAIRVGGDNVTIKNIYMTVTPIYPASDDSTDRGNRKGCIVDSADISDLTISNSYILAYTSDIMCRQAVTFYNVKNLTIIGNYLTTDKTGVGSDVNTDYSYEGFIYYNPSGVFTFQDNKFYYPTTYYSLNIGYSSNTLTEANIIGNTISGNEAGTLPNAEITFRNATSSTIVTIRGNIFKNVASGLLHCRYDGTRIDGRINATDSGNVGDIASGAQYIIEYNVFDENSICYVSYAEVPSKLYFNNNTYLNPNNNCPALSMNDDFNDDLTTYTIDKTTYASASALTNAYQAAYPEDFDLDAHTIYYSYEEGFGENSTFSFVNYSIVQLFTPTKENYRFIGWYENEVLVEALTENRDYNLVARWEILPNYTITYKTNGGLLVEPVRSYNESQTVTLINPTRDSYVFAGWYDNPEFNGDSIYEILSGTTGNLVLYANWQYVHTHQYESVVTEPTCLEMGYTTHTCIRDTELCGHVYIDNFTDKVEHSLEDGVCIWCGIHVYTVTFNADNESENTLVKVDEGQVVAEPTAPEKDGYVFGGWLLNEVSYNFETTVNEDITLVANWLHITTISFETNGGSTVENIVATEGDTIELSTTSKDYYDFEGWYLDSELTNKFTSNIVPATDTILYANYTPTEYTITYNLNEGTNDLQNPSTYTYESADITLKDPTRTGYVFVGWYLEATFETKVTTITSGTTGAIELYARWRPEGALIVNKDATDAEVAAKTYYKTITDALVDSVDGSTIIVYAGDYTDSPTISKPNITILGPNAGVPGTSTKRVSEANMGGVITISASGVTIDGLAFTNKGSTTTYSGSGIVLNGVNNTKLKNIYSIGYRTYGTSDGYDGTNLFRVFIYSGSSVTPDNVLIENVYMYDSASVLAYCPIYLTKAAKVTMSGSLIKNSTTTGWPFTIMNASGDVTLTNNQILFSSGGYGLNIRCVTGADLNVLIRDNVFDKGESTSTAAANKLNTIRISNFTPTNTGYEIHFVGNEIHNQHVSDNNFSFASATSQVYVRYNSFDSSTAANFKYADGTKAAIFEHNYFAGEISSGYISIYDANYTDEQRELDYLSDEYYNPDTAYTITYNNDGDITTQAACINHEFTLPVLTKSGKHFLGWTTEEGSTDYIKVLNQSDDINVTLYANWGDRTPLVVDGIGSEDRHFATITDALNYSDLQEGDIIQVLAGTYDETVTIDTAGIQLIGPNQGISGTSENRNAAATVTGLVTINAADVTIDGMNFEDDGAIVVAGDDVTIQNVHMKVAQTLSTYTYNSQSRNRYGCIVDGAQISNLSILNSYIYGTKLLDGMGEILAFLYVDGLTVKGNYLSTSRTTASSFEAVFIYYLYSYMYFENNELYYNTSGGSNSHILQIGWYGVGAETINIIGNTFAADKDGTNPVGSINFRKASNDTSVLIRGNVFKNSESLFKFTNDGTGSDETGANYTIEYNIFDKNCQYAITGSTIPSSLLINYNCYLNSQSKGSDETLYTHANELIYAYREAYPEESINWELETYTVIYNTAGGNTIESDTFTKLNTIVLPTPTKERAEFLGWYVGETLVTEIDTYQNYVLTAKWGEETRTITYNTNGGNALDPETFTYSEMSTYSFATPTKAGYRFIGWYLNETLVTNIPSFEDITLVAEWEALPVYNISYVLNEGTNPDDVPATYTEADQVTLPTPTREDYVFCGWYETADFSTEVVKTIEVGTTGNKTYYAKWEENRDITVTFDFNGGSIDEPTGDSGAPIYLDEYEFNIQAYDTYGSGVTGSLADGGATGLVTFAHGSTYIYYNWKRILIKYNEELGLWQSVGIGSSTANALDSTLGATHVIGANSSATDTASYNVIASLYTMIGNGTTVYFRIGEDLTDSTLGTKGNAWNQTVQVATEFNATTSVTEPITVLVTEEYSIPVGYKTGYSFAGWYDSEGNRYKTAEDFRTYTKADTLTVTARWLNDNKIIGSFETNSWVVVGDQIQLNAEYELLLDAGFIWVSNNESIATVDENGIVTGVSEGVATIIVYCELSEQMYFTFYVTVFEEDPTGALKLIVDSNNANVYSTYDMVIGGPIYTDSNGTTWGYVSDIIGSVTNLYYGEDFTINDTYLHTTDTYGKFAEINNYGGVEFITFHYGADTPASSTAKNGGSNLAAYAKSAANLSYHFGVGNDGAWAALDEAYAGYHAGTGSRDTTWYASGVYVQEGDPEFAKTTLGSDGYFYINGRRTNYKNETEGTILSEMGFAYKIVDGQYYMPDFWYSSSYNRVCSMGGNYNSIGIESSVRKGSDLWLTWHYSAQLCAHLLIKYNLPLTQLVGHCFWSGKWCPQPMLENDLEIWWIFVEMVRQEMIRMQTYSSYDFTFTSDSQYLGTHHTYTSMKTGRVTSQPEYSECVTYTVTYTDGNTTKTVTLSSIIPGTVA